MAVHKQLNFSIKKKPQTIDYVLQAYLMYFMIKSLRGNCIVRSNAYCTTAQIGWTSSWRFRLQLDLNFLGGQWKVLLKINFKTVNTVLHKFEIIKYTSDMPCVVNCLWFLFNAKI